MTSRGGRRQEHRELARSLRAGGHAWPEIAAVLRERYGLPARVAMRVAHDWSQADAAAAWNTRWPDDPKSFKNISYWETWPSPTGHAPSLAVLDRLAQVYECDVADLVAGWGEHRTGRPAGRDEQSSLAWQVRNLGLPELTRAVADWAQRLPEPRRRELLLKTSTATAIAAGRADSPDGPAPAELVGRWDSRYTYVSSGRGAELEAAHRFRLRLDGARLVGRSEPTAAGSVELDLRADGLLVTGSWTEHTAPDGYYRGAVYHGLVQLVVAPGGRAMAGRWMGPDKDLAVGTGTWTLTRV
ncbi:hypothetical protein [Pseudonocardia humida]|uniref:HTH cro/C1-type domain-containing protein n=1 Tax=Pseudonocardia humida TaxID=2800819 RepID=A0ABT1A9F0_9PSEU|nr:hypothetical protein [Pseudonocardia humida]MCO1659571.1 hypothetical protein [Pseudonocardia humida]